MSEEIFKRVYRRPLKSKTSHLYLDIFSSLLGIKPVFLVDYIPTDPTKLQSLLQDFLPRLLGSRDPAPANQELCVLVLGEDVLLVNYTSLLEHREILPAPIFVDVISQPPELIGKTHTHRTTKQLLTNHLERSFSGCLETIQRYFVSKRPKNDKIPIIRFTPGLEKFVISEDEGGPCELKCEKVNVCSLFGLLLGYPVVYWFDPHKGYSLHIEKLQCHSILVTMQV